MLEDTEDQEFFVDAPESILDTGIGSEGSIAVDRIQLDGMRVAQNSSVLCNNVNQDSASSSTVSENHSQISQFETQNSVIGIKGVNVKWN